MSKVNNLISRNKSLLNKKGHLEPLHTFKNFPVFMGCVKTPLNEDMYADMSWEICNDTGIIQLNKLLPLDILYLNQHNDGTGAIWQDHYKSFAKFISKYTPKNILEIGGAHNHVASNYLNYEKNAEWTILEPNPQNINDRRVTVLKGWFNNDFKTKKKINTIIHSHVLEHVYDPIEFINNINIFLNKGDYHIFSFPNMLPMLKNKYTNCLNFEHTFLLTENMTDYILKKNGFEIIDKKYFGNPHSIFYATKKISTTQNKFLQENEYKENKKIFLEFVQYHKDMINDLNFKINNTTNPIYMFGAHIFSQFLLSFGLKKDKIVTLLDNSMLKQNKRLYGTNFIVKSPKILKNKGEVNVILKAGIYNKEIKKQLLSINKKIIIW